MAERDADAERLDWLASQRMVWGRREAAAYCLPDLQWVTDREAPKTDDLRDAIDAARDGE